MSGVVLGSRFSPELPDYKTPQLFKDLQIHFISIGLIGTLTAGIKLVFLFLTEDIVGNPDSISFQLGMLLCFMATATDVAIIAISVHSAQAASRTTSLHLTSPSPPTIPEYDRYYDQLRQCRLLCESFQTVGMLLFAPVATSFSFMIFTDWIFAVVFSVFVWSTMVFFLVRGFEGAFAPGMRPPENPFLKFSDIGRSEV